MNSLPAFLMKERRHFFFSKDCRIKKTSPFFVKGGTRKGVGDYRVYLEGLGFVVTRRILKELRN